METPAHIRKRAKTEIKPSGQLLALSALAGAMAALGIGLQNIFVLLGSMLVSPFLDPIISVVVYVVLRKWSFVGRGLVVLGAGMVAAAGAAAATFFAMSTKQSIDVQFSVFEPGIEYFVVAVLMGVIGAMLWLWPRYSTTSAGVAIAISLVPPIAEVTKTIILQQPEALMFALTTLGVNLGGIGIGAFLVLLIKQKELLAD